jgi:hypothetical protein
VTVRDLDAEYAFDDPDDGWFGAARPVDAAPARPVQAPPNDDPPSDPDHGHGFTDEHDDGENLADDTDRWFVQDMLAEPVEFEEPPRDQPPRDDPARDLVRDPVRDSRVTESVLATLNVVPTRRNGFVRASAPASWESRLSNSGAWDFKATSGGARYRSKTIVAAAGIVAVLAVIVGIVVMLRAPAVEQSTPVAPSESTAAPAPSTSAPALSSVAQPPLPPPPPPGPPPPPPPSAEEINPPVVQRQYTPRYQTPDEPKKPQTNVTRAPMSATPPAPPRETNRGRATPGESGSHGFFG